MDPVERAQRWAERYRRAWLAGDVEPVVELYAPNAVHRSHPFREPHAGREGVRAYTQAAFAEESAERQVWFGQPVGSGDRAAIEYWATFEENGEPVTLAGCVMLRFDSAGRVLEARDYWDMVPGPRPPPEGWGR
jgi:ketosteroid isomerase-like protein